MQIYFYILMLATGILSVRTDICERKIKNRHLLIISCVAFVAYCVFFITGELRFSPALIINPVAGLLIGFSLYLYGFWKAGDAKLFFTYSLLLPINNYVAVLPLSCFTLFINTFLISFLLIFPFMLYRIINNIKTIIKKVISMQTALYFGKIFLVTLGLSWCFGPLLKILPIKDNIFLNFIVLFSGYSLIYKSINRIRRKVIIILICAIGLILRYLMMPEFFSLYRISVYLGSVFGYALTFYIIIATIEAEKTRWARIPFSPFLFLGALISTTDFLWWVLKVFRYLQS